jgi:predicted enzyme related to lactoylglutathione lyase
LGWSTAAGLPPARLPSRAGWHVDDVAATFERLLSMGAKEYQPITPRGDQGFVTAAVVDPFGNVLGIMYNPHYVETLKSSGKA